MNDSDQVLQNMVLVSTENYEPDTTVFWSALLVVVALAIVFALVEKRMRPEATPFVKSASFGLLLFVTSVIGYVVSILIFTFALYLVLGSLLWLVDQNINSFSGITVFYDAVAASIFILLVRSRRLRQHIVEVWREIRGNI